MWDHAEQAPEVAEDRTITDDRAAREQSRETGPPTAHSPEEPTQSGVQSDESDPKIHESKRYVSPKPMGPGFSPLSSHSLRQVIRLPGTVRKASTTSPTGECPVTKPASYCLTMAGRDLGSFQTIKFPSSSG